MSSRILMLVRQFVAHILTPRLDIWIVRIGLILFQAGRRARGPNLFL